jgi:hypothetical protein
MTRGGPAENGSKNGWALRLGAFQLHNWAVRPEDCMLPLAELAIRILHQDEGGTCEELKRTRDDRVERSAQSRLPVGLSSRPRRDGSRAIAPCTDPCTRHF